MLIEDVLRQHCTDVGISRAIIGRLPQALQSGVETAAINKVSEPALVTKDDTHSIYRCRLQLSLRGAHDVLEQRVAALKAIDMRGDYDSGSLTVVRAVRFSFQTKLVQTEHDTSDLLVYDTFFHYQINN